MTGRAVSCVIVICLALDVDWHFGWPLMQWIIWILKSDWSPINGY